MKDDPQPLLLEFEGADLARTADHGRAPGDGRALGDGLALEDLSLRVAAGALTLVRVPRGPVDLPLADAALGLVAPRRGRVRYLGRDWREVPPSQARAFRGQIGRVHAGTEWVSNLNVDENVLLAHCHHTLRPEAELVEEALALAREFGLSELTSRRPNLVEHHELRAFALVRAFLGAPRLLILERPLRGVVETLLAPLRAAVERVRAAGTGVLWLTPEDAVFESGETGGAVRYVLDGRRLRALEGDRS